MKEEYKKITKDNQVDFSGTLYTFRLKKYPPWKRSGKEGRYNGNGTNVNYFGDSPETSWREMNQYNPNARIEDYDLWGCKLKKCKFIDIGVLPDTRFTQSRNNNGYFPSHELSSHLLNNKNKIIGIRYKSYPALINGTGGTSFCIYEDKNKLSERDFFKIDGIPEPV